MSLCDDNNDPEKWAKKIISPSLGVVEAKA